MGTRLLLLFLLLTSCLNAPEGIDKKEGCGTPRNLPKAFQNAMYTIKAAPVDSLNFCFEIHYDDKTTSLAEFCYPFQEKYEDLDRYIEVLWSNEDLICIRSVYLETDNAFNAYLKQDDFKISYKFLNPLAVDSSHNRVVTYRMNPEEYVLTVIELTKMDTLVEYDLTQTNCLFFDRCLENIIFYEDEIAVVYRNEGDKPNSKFILKW
ncbi:hypothetical protein [Saprospira grandis]|uniref:Lipoprotein n=1 Tax=Saprospira grandis (strain Lewin) TaxID=984262 RepID=H6L555_SAPGL|nr:hypothetical protein [Saprospira grandis]AFC22927.1 hypothetical protein SGRA_0186 [Saprospira grandis str. Lewin]